MDANNLNQRIERIYHSLSLLKNENLNGLKVEVGTSGNFNYVRVDFNNDKTEAELKNSVFSLIGNIALLKEHLKVFCKKNEIKYDVENIIDSNKSSVAIIHDLNNIEKHLELDRLPRSGFLPKIINLQQALQTSAGSEAGSYAVFTLNPTTGEIKTETGGSGTVTLVINGNIVNEKGETVGELMQICSDAIDVWENEITNLGIALA